MSDATNDALRPTTEAEFVGQTRLVSRLKVHAHAAIVDQRPIEHIFLAGRPGFGKTSLAGIVADWLGEPLYAFTMPIKPKAFERFLRDYTFGVVLLDEIHRAARTQQEDLLNLLEDRYLMTSTGRRIETPCMEIIGATTRPQDVDPAVLDRFSIRPTFEDYSDDELGRMVMLMAAKTNTTVSPDTAAAIGRAAGGTPRNARTLVLAARDLERQTGRSATAKDVLDLCRVDADGLEANHVAYLKCLDRMAKPTGLRQMSNILRLPEAVVEELEFLLLKQDLITYTAQGRDITDVGSRKLRADTLPAFRSRFAA